MTGVSRLKRSTERILTTHVGSLVRTPEILQGMKARVLNRPHDREKFATDVRKGILEVVRKQAEIGIDIPSDGEYGRQGFRGYVNERLGGIVPRDLHTGEDPWQNTDGQEQPFFPDFFAQYYTHYRYLWMAPEVSLDDVPNRPGNYQRYRVTGPITYTGQSQIQHDVTTLKAAQVGHNFVDAFIPADVPTGRIDDDDILTF